MKTKRQMEEYLQQMTYRVDEHNRQRVEFAIGKGLDLTAEMAMTTLYDDEGYPVDCMYFRLALVDNEEIDNEEKEEFASAYTFLDKVGDIDFEQILGQLNKNMEKRLGEMRKENNENYERVAELADEAASVLFDEATTQPKYRTFIVVDKTEEQMKEMNEFNEELRSELKRIAATVHELDADEMKKTYHLYSQCLEVKATTLYMRLDLYVGGKKMISECPIDNGELDVEKLLTRLNQAIDRHLDGERRSKAKRCFAPNQDNK